MGQSLSRPVVVAVGVAYPAYMTYKALIPDASSGGGAGGGAGAQAGGVEHHMTHAAVTPAAPGAAGPTTAQPVAGTEQERWLQYWAVYGCVSMVEWVLDKLIVW